MKIFQWLRTTGTLALLLAFLAACSGPAPTPSAPAGSLVLSSSAFAAGGSIPQRYTCDADDVSPPLLWTDPPAGTRSFALVMDDPDAGGFRHWLVYDIPATARALPEAVPVQGDLADGARQGNNSWNKVGYGGPCPPSGTHRYSFRLYALGAVLELPAGAELGSLYEAMQGHVLAQAELVGAYTRQK
jgi:Raf kinase inhibitor-like YbhB/YbcL family protein